MARDNESLRNGIASVLSIGSAAEAKTPVRRVSESAKSDSPVAPNGYIGHGRPAAGQTTGWEGVDVIKTSFNIPRAKYEAMRAISMKHGILLKTLVDEFITDGILKYNKK